MALFQGTKKLFGPLLDDLVCVSADKEVMELQVEACMRWRCFKGQEAVPGPLLDDLYCLSVVKEAMELQVEACMKEEDEVAAATITQAPSARARTS
jgi:hypothetical protein